MQVEARQGDKARLKLGPHAGERCRIEAVDGSALVISLDKTGRRLRVRPEQLTNYSLAARKAWATDPDRAVGRRRGTKLTDRVSVTLRFDRDTWEQFTRMEADGLIKDRTAAINRWVRDKLADLQS